MELSFWVWCCLLGGWFAFMVPLMRERLRETTTDWQPWHVVLGGEMQARYEYLREIFEGNAELVDALLGAGPAPAGVERNHQSLSWGLTAVDEFSGTARERLSEWRVLARVLDAELPGPLPRVYPMVFALPRLRCLAWRHALCAPLGRFIGGIFESRLAFLEKGFGVVCHAGAAVPKVTANPGWAMVRQRANALASDFGLLSSDTLAAVRVLLALFEQRR